jgi:tetratricopeptide (TPR) repeat protein
MTGRSNANIVRNPLAPPASVMRKLREALAAQQSGRFDKAERLYSEVLKQRPQEFDALHLLGLLKYQRGNFSEALRLIGAALRSHGDSADAWSNLGLVFHALGDNNKALKCYDQALALQPDHPDVLNNRGNALNGLGRHDDALACFARALAARPDYIAAQFNLGSTLLALGRLDEALARFDATLKTAPNHAETLCHRGNALMTLNRLDEALGSYFAAARAAPDNPVMLHNLAHTLRLSGRPREAQAAAEAAARLKPDYAEAHFENGLALLALGRLREGFAAHEWRWATAEFASQRRHFTAPQWQGGDLTPGSLSGRTLLVHAEQGFGDTLHFVRYLPLLADTGATVILEVQPQLKSLLSGIAGASMVVARGEALPAFDLHCPLMSLPHAFATALDSIPANVPYLAAEPARIAHFAGRLAEAPGRKIGLVWAGESRKHDPKANVIDARRSISLAQFAPLATLGGVTFVSLQKGAPAAQALTPPSGMTLIDWTAELEDFADTAALIAGLDLVVSVDTAVAHLAGGLGKPVWILSRYAGCWRWLDGREDSPWYPTARLFHQRTPGAWDEVVTRVNEELRNYTAE